MLLSRYLPVSDLISSLLAMMMLFASSHIFFQPLIALSYLFRSLFSTLPVADFLFSAGSGLRLEKIEWHPLSNAHLVVLTSDNFIRHVRL